MCIRLDERDMDLFKFMMELEISYYLIIHMMKFVMRFEICYKWKK